MAVAMALAVGTARPVVGGEVIGLHAPDTCIDALTDQAPATPDQLEYWFSLVTLARYNQWTATPSPDDRIRSRVEGADSYDEFRRGPARPDGTRPVPPPIEVAAWWYANRHPDDGRPFFRCVGGATLVLGPATAVPESGELSLRVVSSSPNAALTWGFVNALPVADVPSQVGTDGSAELRLSRQAGDAITVVVALTSGDRLETALWVDPGLDSGR